MCQQRADMLEVKKRSKEENLQEEGEMSRGDEGRRLVEGGGESAARGVATWSYETNHVKHVNVETQGVEDCVLESPGERRMNTSAV